MYAKECAKVSFHSAFTVDLQIKCQVSSIRNCYSREKEVVLIYTNDFIKINIFKKKTIKFFKKIINPLMALKVLSCREEYYASQSLHFCKYHYCHCCIYRPNRNQFAYLATIRLVPSKR